MGAVVAALWRYPVKSLQGEQLTSAQIVTEGLLGDRRYAIFDCATGFGITARRHPQLLYAQSVLEVDGSVRITLPDGRMSEGDADLSDWLERPVALRRADEPGERRYESLPDFENEESATWDAFNGSMGAFHDLSAASVSLVATATLGDWDARRFRTNVLLDMGSEPETQTETQTESALVGKRVRLGSAELSVRRRLGRCVVTTRPQPGGIERDLDVLRTINREMGGELAVGALVTAAGSVSVGDAVHELIDPTPAG